MNKFIINRNTSKVYKFFSLLYPIPILNMFLSNVDQVDGIFRDICTFIRITLLTFFISLPILIFIIIGLFNFLIYQPIMSLLDSNYIFGSIVINSYISVFILYLFFLMLEYLDIRKNNIKKEYHEDNNIEETKKITSFFKLISSKHRDLCQRIEIKD